MSTAVRCDNEMALWCRPGFTTLSSAGTNRNARYYSSNTKEVSVMVIYLGRLYSRLRSNSDYARRVSIQRNNFTIT